MDAHIEIEDIDDEKVDENVLTAIGDSNIEEEEEEEEGGGGEEEEEEEEANSKVSFAKAAGDLQTQKLT
ncbi:hypothetical protein H5410_027406 [Solanum commersonii]|uniref:Uncharacterized protein n=1 Tax=Solanum commersonii TaxID=4109 RepID=A0A9J5YZR7_SOLCO|nr:hypothetical protein H5410_027406 [Solanum commersonii]